MKRQLALLAAAMLVGITGTAGVHGRTAPLLSRSFTAGAEAFPVEPGPGQHDTSLGGRPYGTRAEATNAPAQTHGLASVADLGIIENYTQPVGPRAESNYPPTNVPADSTVDQGATHLESHSDARPSTRSRAVGSGSAFPGGGAGSMSSASTADGGGDTLVASVEAEANDVTVGPLTIASARFRGRATVNGRPGGASAEGVVEVSGAAVNGVPVVITNDGVTVDETNLSAAQVTTLSAAVSRALSQGGFARVEVVQPVLETAKDGTKASVSGGGVLIRFDDPSPREYFFSLTLVGGTAAVALGPPLGDAAVAVPAAPTIAPPPPVATPDNPPAIEAAAPALPPPATIPFRARERLTLTAAGGDRSLHGPWRGWRWLVLAAFAGGGLAGMLFLPALAPTRRRVELVLGSAYDRYLRG